MDKTDFSLMQRRIDLKRNFLLASAKNPSGQTQNSLVRTQAGILFDSLSQGKVFPHEQDCKLNINNIENHCAPADNFTFFSSN